MLISLTQVHLFCLSPIKYRLFLPFSVRGQATGSVGKVNYNIYIYIYIYVYIYIYMYIYICIYICMYVCVCVLYVCIYHLNEVISQL